MRFKIFLSLIISFILVRTLNYFIFFDGLPKINREKINRLRKDIRDELIIFKNTFTYKYLAKEKFNYENNLDKIYSSDFQLEPITIAPTSILIPTQTSTPIFNEVISPTIKVELRPLPTSLPTPTVYLTIKEPTITLKPTPTSKLKKNKINTPTPETKLEMTNKKNGNNENSNQGAIFISNPLSEPYYNPSLAYKCYNPENFIKLYGGGIKTNSCYSDVKKYVESNLTSVTIMGKTIPVHKKAYSAFKAVADRLKDYKGYKINTIGSYVFRCNVNASTSDRNDLCSQGCVLSAHSFGIAVDINWDENCNGCDNFTMPREIVDAFESYGFRWGGRYKAIFGARIDAMHFEYLYDLCKDLK